MAVGGTPMACSAGQCSCPNGGRQRQERSVATAQDAVHLRPVTNHVLAPNRAAIVLEFQVMLLGYLGARKFGPEQNGSAPPVRHIGITANGEFDSRAGLKFPIPPPHR